MLSGLSNVVLDWPLLAALLHTAGAAGFVALLVSLVFRSRPQPARASETIDVALQRRHA